MRGCVWMLAVASYTPLFRSIGGWITLVKNVVATSVPLPLLLLFHDHGKLMARKKFAWYPVLTISLSCSYTTSGILRATGWYHLNHKKVDLLHRSFFVVQLGQTADEATTLLSRVLYGITANMNLTMIAIFERGLLILMLSSLICLHLLQVYLYVSCFLG
jgi:hypothetical protein